MNSCIYEGRVRHSRKVPATHRFNYRLFMMYLDLDELPTLFDKRWLWSSSRPAIARFRRRDHLGPRSQRLSESVRDLVENETGIRPTGSICLLTNLSYFGYCFNPVSFYYCYSENGETLETIVAEVNNTPWGESDTYVLDCTRQRETATTLQFRPTKKMHVSPFMSMNVDYHWALTRPDERLSVFMASSTRGKRFFSASMSLNHKEISGWSLSGILIRFPFMTLKVITAIYWQALRLWVKGVPFHMHPGKTHSDENKEVVAR